MSLVRSRRLISIEASNLSGAFDPLFMLVEDPQQ